MTNTTIRTGTIAWVDLTIANASEIRDFYKEVVGWDSADVSQGEYDDYNMIDPESKTPITGICHKRDFNADMPSAWIVYITVPDVKASVEACTRLGGKVVKNAEKAGYCIVQDPAGAHFALYQAPKQ